MSDRCFAGISKDLSGPLLRGIIEHGSIPRGQIAVADCVADEREAISSKLVEWCDNLKLNLIFTTGGISLVDPTLTARYNSFFHLFFRLFRYRLLASRCDTRSYQTSHRKRCPRSESGYDTRIASYNTSRHAISSCLGYKRRNVDHQPTGQSEGRSRLLPNGCSFSSSCCPLNPWKLRCRSYSPTDAV